MTQHQTFTPHPGITLAFHRIPGKSRSLPSVIFLGGFRSDMTGTKAAFLEAQCQRRGQAFVRFDYRGHGASSGVFTDLTLGDWFRDSLDVFDNMTEGMQVVVGSSMGGWIALLLTMARAERVCGLIGLAAAPDFTKDVYEKEFREEERRHLAAKGLVYRESAYGEPYPLTAKLFKEAQTHLLLDKKIGIQCPVRLIHGKQDPDVPWQKSDLLAKQLLSDDVKTLWVPDGDHRLSRPEDLALLDKTVVELSHKHQVKLATSD